MDLEEFAEAVSLSKETILSACFDDPSDIILEKIYSYIYNHGYCLSDTKSIGFTENLKEGEKLFFHGSKQGITAIHCDGSRVDADFSNGFYCTMRLDTASNLAADYKGSSVYVFKADLSELNCYTFGFDLEWMLAVLYYRLKLSDDINTPYYIRDIVRPLESVDVIIAPIADNQMTEILDAFINGKTTYTQALYAFTAAGLGTQYVFKTQKAVDQLKFLDRFYLCDGERLDIQKSAKENKTDI